MGSFTERRRFFRVGDTVGLAFRAIDSDDEGGTEDSYSYAQSAALLRLENKINIALENVRNTNSPVANVLELFNQKINLALSIESYRQYEDLSHAKRTQFVNLSACGIAFSAGEQVHVGAAMQLHLTLYPSNISMSLRAVVIDCSEQETENGTEEYLVRADFAGIEDDNQELLIQHILKCQSRELKKRREAKSQGDG